MSRSNRIKESFVRSTVSLERDWSNPYGRSSSKVCRLQNVRTKLGEKEYRKDMVNLVSISLPHVPKSARIPRSNAKVFPLQHNVLTYSKAFSESLFTEYKECLKIAAEELDADVICINELGMPLRADGAVRTQARQFAKKLANKHNCLIIGGSNHDVGNFMNIGYMIYPGTDSDNGKEYIEFYKNISAVQVNEKIFTPSDRVILTTSAFGLGISFVICLEMVDYATSSLIAGKRDVVALLLVPTYVLGEFGVMGRVAECLSQVIGGVLMSNCYTNEDNPSSKLIINGREPAGGASRVVRQTKSGDSKVILRTIDVKNLKNGKVEANKNMSKELRCLYSIGPAGLDFR